jgi:acetyl esterase
MSDPQSAILSAIQQAGLSDRFGPGKTAPALREALKRLMPFLEAEPPPVHAAETIRLPGGDGERDARLYTPFSAPERGPTLLFLHGGGFVIGSLETYEGLCKRLCAMSGARVVSLDYRLAPEHRFPAANADAEAAFDALSAGHLDCVDPERLAVGGDSAGGGLAASLAQTRRGKVAFQLLIYPLLQLVSIKKDKPRWQEGPILSTEMLAQIRETYLEDPGQASDPRVSPLLETDLKGLAPVYMLAAELDPLRDEGLAYADRLAAFGVPCEREEFAGAAHGFLNATRLLPQAREGSEKAARALAAGLGV